MVSTLAPSSSRTREPAPELQFTGITHRYSTRGGSVLALSDVTFAVAPGSFTCLVGPSGCGKSTLLELVAGLQTSSEGSVQVGGRPVSGPNRNAAMVFQQPALFPWKTVLGNITAGLRARGMSRPAAEAKAHENLAAVGLEEFAQRYPHELSGGMAQRVGIARALALEPSLLLMDEPFAAVDAQTRAHLQSELLALMDRRAMTVMFITHDVSEAVYLGDEVIVMSARPGRVLAQLAMKSESRDRSTPYFAATTASVLDLLENKTEDKK